MMRKDDPAFKKSRRRRNDRDLQERRINKIYANVLQPTHPSLNYNVPMSAAEERRGHRRSGDRRL